MVSGSRKSSAETSELEQAEQTLAELAEIFLHPSEKARHIIYSPGVCPAGVYPPGPAETTFDPQLPNVEARYRALVEQIPAVVFMAYLDRGIGEAYVSPQIESALGFSQEEWLEDPVRWYEHIHPDDKQRWNVEAAEMFLTGNPLRSAYRVLSRDGRVVWFHCEAKMIRKASGEPWFIHGVGFDITDLKQTEEALQKERNFAAAVLDTVAALVVVLDSEGRIVRFNRACEQLTGYRSKAVERRFFWDIFFGDQEAENFKSSFRGIRPAPGPQEFETSLVNWEGRQRTVAWSTTFLAETGGTDGYVIVSGIDISERKHLEKSILDISAREQRRIGQDLHDGLGQHLTGIAFMTKVQEQKMIEKSLPEAADAAKIVDLVNEAIHKTRELARGLLPVVTDSHGLMSALKHWAGEVETLFAVNCRFDCFSPVLIHDTGVATHLYYIAREAVNNAIKHGQARNIVISLASDPRQGSLRIQDDGCGIASGLPGNKGMGLHLMNYRARMVGGSIEINRVAAGGTMVACFFPIPPEAESAPGK